MSPRRFAALSFDAAVNSPKKLSAGLKKMREGRSILKFENAADPSHPLIIRPPEGLSALQYRQVLLISASETNLDSLKLANRKFRTELKKEFEAVSDTSKASKKTTARALAHTLIALHYK